MKPPAPDCILGGLCAAMAILGLIRGFSGIFAFLCGTATGAAAVVWAWPTLLGGFDQVWVKALLATAAFIVIFGIVRMVVKAIAAKLLDTPADRLFGVCFGLLCGALLLWAASMNPEVRERSRIAREVHVHVGGR
ncbi:MAG: CvpA family protein [Kiritimatiellae bacterium]|nr:CvpA family protein [Kiritimatiellia bacterium]